MDVLVIPVIDYKTRALCRKAYQDHANGCPAFGKHDRCPPRAPLICNILDLSKPVWAVYNMFDMASHMAKMREKHPSWTERQLVNCLYWQPSARKALKEEVKKFLRSHSSERLVVAETPEAMGVNVTATMLTAGIELEWPPRKIAYQIVLAGSRPSTL